MKLLERNSLFQRKESRTKDKFMNCTSNMPTFIFLILSFFTFLHVSSCLAQVTWSANQTISYNVTSSSANKTISYNATSSSANQTISYNVTSSSANQTRSSNVTSHANRTITVRAWPSVVYLNSTDPLIWYNNDSITGPDLDGASSLRVILQAPMYEIYFVCGFYCIAPCYSYLLSVLVVRDGEAPGLIWSANRHHPVKENATLQLKKDGNLVLKDSDGSEVWSTNISTSNNSIIGMSLDMHGDLVLFDKEQSSVWNSNDNPTDTLIMWQEFREGQKLIASSSTTNWSLGQYYATITSAAGFAVFVETGQGPPLMYYQLKPNPLLANYNGSVANYNGSVSKSNGSQKNYAVLDADEFFVIIGSSQTKRGISFHRYADIMFMRLEGDGSLKVYQFSNSLGLTVAADLIDEDWGECQRPLSCGEYGVCRDGQCSCPEGPDGIQYFNQTRFGLPNQGCSRITPLSCQRSSNHRLVEVRNATYFNIIDSNSAVPVIKSMEECKQACLKNCSCGGIFFKYETNVLDGHCYMPSKMLSLREANQNFSSATFLKVQIQPEGPGNGLNLAAVIAGSTAAFFLICVVIFILVIERKRVVDVDRDDSIKQVLGTPVSFSYIDLRNATEDFKERLGSGGFGTVFKGVLADGTGVAVKRLDKLSQGMREFLAEVETIGSIHHFDLVRLVGYCAEKTCRLLVYEYMSNGSLDNWIFSNNQISSLDWQTRKKIILDIAKGLAYLHEECRQRIVHLDIKPQNILLDGSFNAKVSDFGLSTLFDRDKSQILTTMRGTPGYLAPEWRQLRITVKVDIYSFGIVLLETVCKRKNFDPSRSESRLHLLEVLQKKAEEGRVIEIVECLDEEMENHEEEVVRMIRIAAWCLQNDPKKRPLMSTVVKALEGVLEVDPDITYSFLHVTAPPATANNYILSAPEASVLSAPR